MGLENSYEDLLQNIEFALASNYRNDPSLRDVDVIKALEALTKYYQRKAMGREAEKPELPEKSSAVFESVIDVLAMREDIIGEPEEKPARRAFSRALRKTTKEEIFLACLRKIEKSVKRWNKRYGARGYFDFVKDFVP